MGRRFFIDVESVPPAEEYRPTLNREFVRQLCKKGEPRQAESRSGQDSEEECTDEEFRMLALHAEYGRILAIGVIVEQDYEVLRCGVLGRDRATGQFHMDEARTLRGFWKLIKDFNVRRDLVIGHNILDFDLPFIYKRSRIHRIRPSVTFSFARYRSAPVYDTMREWAHWGSKATYVSLANLGEILRVGITKMDGVNGSRVYSEFTAGNHELIARYCLQDVKVVRAIYYRMAFPDGPEPPEVG